MMAHPDMVAGPGRFDTALMAAFAGQIVVKGGAEGYQALGIMPGLMGPDSPALGVTLKIAGGDLTGRARPLVMLEILRQLGVPFTPAQNEALAEFDVRPVKNWRKLDVGQMRTCFQLRGNNMKSNDQKTLSHFAKEIHQRLLCFYGEPEWRNPLPPVDELVSTILSQNTNDVNRDKAFDKLRERFPTWEAVRDAPRKKSSKPCALPGWPTRKARASRRSCARSPKNAAALT